MDASWITTPGPDLGLDLTALLTPAGWVLVGSLLATVMIIAVAGLQANGLGLSDLIGAATAGTIAEPLGNLALDTVALVAAARWYVADVLLAWQGLAE